MGHSTANEKLITPVVLWFLITMVLANTASYMLFFLLPVYIVEKLGATAEQLGLIFTVVEIVPLLLQVFGGWFSDRVGRLPTIALGAGIATFGYFGIALAPDLVWLTAALMVEFVSLSLIGPSYGAFVADQSSHEKRGRAFGMVDSVFQLVGIIGPPLGGFLVFNFSFGVMMWTAAIMYAVATILRIWMALRFKDQDRPRNGGQLSWSGLKSSVMQMFGMIIGGGLLTWLFITDGLRDSATFLSQQMEPLYYAEVGMLNEQQIGILGAITNAAMLFTLPLAGWLSDRIQERRSITFGFIVLSAAYLILVQAGGLPGFVLARLVMGVGFGLLLPPIEALVSKIVSPENRGVTYGLFWTSINLVSLPAPLIGGMLWDRVSPQSPFLLTAGLLLLAVVPSWSKLKLPPVSDPETVLQ